MDRRTRWQFFAVAAIIAVVIYVYPLTLSTPLLDPDEGLHAAISQEMVEGGDFVVPRLFGQPFLDKPILYFLAQAGSLRVFGMNEAAVRAPGFFFALLGCFTTWLLARRLFDAEAALYALLAALTMVVPLSLAQAAAHDVALVPWINLLILCVWELQQAASSKERWAWLTCATICMAIALLTKGLIGIALAFAGVGLYAIVARQLSWRLIIQGGLALLGGAALASPWFLAMEQASPGYLSYYFVDRHLMGFLTDGQQHGQESWYYYLAPVLIGSLPWSLYAAASVVQLRHEARDSDRHRAVLLLALWITGGMLFLMVAGSKLVTYALPLYPPVAVLAGEGYRRFVHDEFGAPIRHAFTLVFRLACVIGALAPFALLVVLKTIVDAPSPVMAYLAVSFASASLMAALAFFERGRPRAALAIGTLAFPTVFAAIVTWPLQTIAERSSQRALEMEITRDEGHFSEIVLVGERPASLIFYLSPEERARFRTVQLREGYGTQLKELLIPTPGRIVVVKDDEVAIGGRPPEGSCRAGVYFVIKPEPANQRVAGTARAVH